MAELHDICKAKKQYLTPGRLGYTRYFDHLEAFNDAILYDLSEMIGELFHPGDDLAICTTGSDSRLEKGPRSDLELMVLMPDKTNSERGLNDLKYLMHYCNDIRFDDKIECKYIEEGDLSTSKFEMPDGREITMVSPDRMIDCSYLGGSFYLFNRGRKKFVQELSRQDYGKRIFNRMKDRIRLHRATTRTGLQKYKGDEVMHVDIASGKAFYDPNNGIYSFKQGPLRAIQTSLVRDFVKGIKQEMIDPKHCFTYKQGGQRQGVVPKLNYLRVRDMLSINDDDFNDLTDCYKFFLWGYHVSEYNYFENNSKVSDFEQADVAERSDFVDNICSKPLLNLGR